MFGTGIVLGLEGYSYHRYYKWLILHKMERAFRPGDPVLEIAGATTSRAEARHRQVDDRDSEYQLEVALRPEQAWLDAIVTGAE